MNAPESPGSSAGLRFRYKTHWHALLTHFPISAFLGAFLFMALHAAVRNSCFALAAYVSLLAGAAVMLPVTLTGWIEWKNRYRGARGRTFVNKIRISFAMIGLSVVLVAYQTVYPFEMLDVWHSVAHLLYFTGVTLLMLGAVAEGYYGGRLNHR